MYKRQIIACVKDFEESTGKKIPVVFAGGVFDRKDIDHCFELGLDGVQMATRFVATEECDADVAFKQAYVDAKPGDAVIVKSPVGMPGRALNNNFIAVSYTHLDVYKRQDVKFGDNSNADEAVAKILEKKDIFGVDLKAVSYTHLDVYKRQVPIVIIM